MAFDPATGEWKPQDDSVSGALKGLLDTNSPLMQQGKTAGLQFANKRGLANSSIAAGASEAAVLDRALPIASQEAAQTAQKNLGQMGIDSTQKIGFANIASNDREKATAATTAMQNIYNQSFQTIANNENLPVDIRNQYLAHLAALRDSDMNLIEQLYGIQLDWATPAAT